MLEAWGACGYGPAMIERARGGLVLACLLAAACAQTAPPPKTPATAPGAVVVAKTPAQPSVGPPVTLLPAATARPYQLATVSVGSVDRLLANGVKLIGSAVPIPMTPEGVRDMLLANAGLAPEVAANLDLASPGGAAVVALDDKGRTGLVMAIPARGPAEAEKLIAALGKPVMTSGPLTMIANGSGKSQGWVYRAGSVVVLGDEVEGMARGTMLALEARRASADDVTTTLYPEAIARAHGTDVKSAITQALDQLRQLQQATSPSSATDSSVYDMLGKMLSLVGDAERVEIGLSIDPARGLTLRTRLMARPGTGLEGVAREVRPFQIDPAIWAGATGAPMMIGASSIGTFWRDVFGVYRARLAASKEKGAAAALLYYDAYIAAVGGMQSMLASVAKAAPYFTVAFSTSLKDAASAAKLGTALGHMDSAATIAFIRSQFPSALSFDLTAKRETVGKLKAVRINFTVKKGSVLDTETMRHLLAKGGLDLYEAVAGTRLLVTFGRDARARLTAVAAGKAGAAKAAAFTEAETSAKGRDSFNYFDFAPVLGLLGSLGVTPELTAAKTGNSGPIPMIVTAGGDGAGKTWTMDLTFPPATFNSVGALIAARAMGQQ